MFDADLRIARLLPLIGLIAACQARNVSPTLESPAEAAVLSSPSPTESPAPTATKPAITPPALPGSYQSPYLDPSDTVHTYIQDSCLYLREKWSPANSAPGTIVMVIMLHSINQGKAEGPDAINETDFAKMMAELRDQKFEAITMLQLADFLEKNAPIPARSVALIQDGRRYAENYDQHFRLYWDQWGWPVINAWDSQANSTDALWDEQSALESQGWVDHEVYGPTLNLNAPLSDEALKNRLQTPLGDFQEHFGKAPIGVIWPNGFDRRSAQVARSLGYRLGFTFNPRGPLMFNWVPLVDEADKMRPSYVPEGDIADRLMTLPRYWPYQVHTVLDAVRITGKEAAAFAEQNRATEMTYYDLVCANSYGPIQ